MNAIPKICAVIAAGLLCAVQAQAASMPSAHAYLQEAAGRGLARAARIVPPARNFVVGPQGADVISPAGAQLHESALGRASSVAAELAPPARDSAVVA